MDQLPDLTPFVRRCEELDAPAADANSGRSSVPSSPLATISRNARNEGIRRNVE